VLFGWKVIDWAEISNDRTELSAHLSERRLELLGRHRGGLNSTGLQLLHDEVSALDWQRAELVKDILQCGLYIVHTAH